ncbi:MAG TPA: hypothetical protein DGG94_03075 [Micromonosporaceae bacterium]|nr:hypothetical protein [Micromonosporaceae bacterium]HCU48798.1 hypothetical protein [Micromonosporaceae bacterium]
MDIVTGATATRRAAVHLLTYTELPDRPGFAELVEIMDLEWDHGDIVRMGQVSDWAALLDFAATAGLSDSEQRMIALAVSLASGQPVDLAANIAVSGPAHARRVIEAIAIATGYSDMYAVTEKPDEKPVRRAHA